MTIKLPPTVLFILETFRTHNYEAYLVGGAVRDLLLGEKHEVDFDFTTNATPEQILALFPNSFYENDFGTVSISPTHTWEIMGIQPPTSQEVETKKSRVIDAATATKLHVSLAMPKERTQQEQMHNFEMTTFRSDGVYTDHRKPESVSWGQSLNEDLSRRDFTMNAMAIRVTDERLHNWKNAAPVEQHEYELIDPFHGRSDLSAKLINTVGDPAARFEEDALRMLRAVRFSVQLNMRMTDEVFTAISALADHIQHISWERIRDEFLKMLASEYPAEAVELLDETNLLEYILPELREGKGVEQGGHHNTDVWVHSLDALRSCPSHDPVVRLATLLHDIAKPRTFRIIDGQPTFYNHEIIGARVAKDIARRLRLSNHDCDRIFTLVRQHMFYYQPHHTDAAIRRFMRNVGLENIDDILDLREGDRLGSGARKTSWRLEEMKQRMIEQLHQPFAITDLAIDGDDIMREFHLQPGKEIGRILHTLFEKVVEEPEFNTPEQLFEEVKKML